MRLFRPLVEPRGLAEPACTDAPLRLEHYLTNPDHPPAA
jgi:hypothetical protein